MKINLLNFMQSRIKTSYFKTDLAQSLLFQQGDPLLLLSFFFSISNLVLALFLGQFSSFQSFTFGNTASHPLYVFNN